ncbi:MAG: hypothetical protein HQL56_19620, partial [Magnetococcales bacterium]|nr:hypothetical protein [Magnetococcales bacterium]
MTQQPDLFAPSLNSVRDFKEALNRATRESGLSRAQILDKLNAVAGRYGINLAAGNAGKLSLETLEKWLNPEAEAHVPPLKALPVLMRVIGSPAVLEALVGCLGWRVIEGQDVVRL